MISIKLILAIIILLGSDLISLWGIKQYKYGDKWIKITFIILGLSGTTTGILAILIRITGGVQQIESKTAINDHEKSQENRTF